MKRLLVLLVLFGMLVVMVRPCFVVALGVLAAIFLSLLLLRFQLHLLVAFRWFGSCFLLEFGDLFCLFLSVSLLAGSIGPHVGIESKVEKLSIRRICCVAELIARSGCKP